MAIADRLTVLLNMKDTHFCLIQTSADFVLRSIEYLSNLVFLISAERFSTQERLPSGIHRHWYFESGKLEETDITNIMH